MHVWGCDDLLPFFGEAIPRVDVMNDTAASGDVSVRPKRTPAIPV
jgi:hypothetical protein